MIVLGLDLALGRTGWAIVGDGIADECGSFTVPKPPWNKSTNLKRTLGNRYTCFRTELEEVFGYANMKAEADNSEIVVVLEDLVESFAIRKLAPIRGIAEQLIDEWFQVDPRLVIATSVKLLATGSGKADKMDMEFAANLKLGMGVQNDDEADALWIADFGARSIGMTRPELPQSHLEALQLRVP